MRILLVEDDEQLCHFLKLQLIKEGFEVDDCKNGEDALYFISQRSHDLVLLDRMLPGMDGLAVLKNVRNAGIHIPVILITALGELGDKITGLDCGADDYLVKPFAHEELMARIRCIIRRPKQLALSDLLTRGDITYRLEEKMLTGPGGSCSLSKKEGNLLEAFLRNPGQILPRATLMVKGWGTEAEVEDSSLNTYVHFLRQRLRAVKSRLILKTVRGIGYRLENKDVS
ncbi:response regulator transcription factor [Lachnospiraceae bacterium ASD3451]|uniref:response regulator transcription factor n=1 Tax=Diplocloster agilis TaxID=2850323 RepID=UPI001D7F845A|nr:response regulator transcription factor [Diplocloster agilis]MBU9742522.1 response regulator transcription factor [Diplocloster agilis]